MRIPIEINDKTVVLINKFAELSGLSRAEVVENTLREIIAKDQKRIKNRQLKERNLESEN